MTPLPERKKVLELALARLESCREVDFGKDIAKDLELRAEQGVEEYGTYLSTFNGRDSLVDLYEELLDAYMYAAQYEEENRGSAWDEDSTPVPLFSLDILHLLDVVVESILARDSEPTGVLGMRKPQPQPSLFKEQ